MKLNHFLLMACCIFSYMQPVIIEHNSIFSILNHLDPQLHQSKNVLIIFDIDNTLVSHTYTLNPAHWLTYFKESYFSDDAMTNLPFSDRIQFLLNLTPLEKNTPAFISQLQNAGYVVRALTARPAAMAQRTTQQLHAIDIDFSYTNNIAEKIPLPLPAIARAENGIIYCGTNNKGATLKEYLKISTLQPRRVIYIDDVDEHVKNVHAVAQELAIDAVAIWFRPDVT